MARVLGEEFAEVWATDVHDYGYEGMAGRVDFLMPDLEPPVGIDWIITNPPFRLGPQFILRALELAEVGVAVLVRTSFDEGAARYHELFRDRPETWALPFVERVVMWQGAMIGQAFALRGRSGVGQGGDVFAQRCIGDIARRADLLGYRGGCGCSRGTGRQVRGPVQLCWRLWRGHEPVERRGGRGLEPDRSRP